MTDSEKISLPTAWRELRMEYRKLYDKVLEGRVPVEQVNGRYQVNRADLPAIAATLGLSEPGYLSTPKASVPTRRRRSELAEV